MIPVHAVSEALRWVQDEVQAGRPLPLMEAGLIVETLQLALEDSDWQPPLIEIREPAEYPVLHPLNVALLAMRIGRDFQVAGEDARSLGFASLFFDIGTLLLPREMLRKPEALTAEERAVVLRHPIEGARILFQSDASLDLAAIVAYEHHIRMDGGGYPTFRFPRSCHFASRLVQLCDVFDALRTARPHKEAWPLDIVLSYLKERSGFEFDPEIARALSLVVGQLRSAGRLREAIPAGG
jgi:HD-GYP domain-containing protein (c-di-GMP phosphodiesterase class II)